MTNKLKDNYEIRLRCATCGGEDQFEFNDDKSYIKDQLKKAFKGNKFIKIK